MSDESSYAIGVDLGTTHCALSFVDVDLSEGEEVAQHTLPVAQVVAPGETASKDLLPSFLYLPHDEEFAAGELQLPWPSDDPFLIGEFARRHGSQSPLRLISSAKSWLSHAAVDRRAPILPPDADRQGIPQMSPLDVSVRYLEHLRQAFSHRHPEADFAEQAVTLTVPASFDPAARDLTAESARRAGFGNAVLLEEPQAALYSWIQRSQGQWRDAVHPGDLILVVDVGGGTTDFSLIAVAEDGGSLSLNRVAVGDHILLGGDNMDLALAHIVRQKLESDQRRLDDWQHHSLVHACRDAKETLLADPSLEAATVALGGRGSRLVGGALSAELTRGELESTLLEGFFPEVGPEAAPATRPRSALMRLGLPYAQDTAITRHLAAFLRRHAGALHRDDAPVARPTAVLFNGGVFKSPLLIDRVREALNAWMTADGAKPVRVLPDADLDTACARGAAYYGYTRTHGGVRIRGGTAKSYYVGVEASAPAVPGIEPPVSALCVAPFGLEEGSDSRSPTQNFGLVVGERVKFRFFGSSVRRDDEVGTALDRWSDEEVAELEGVEVCLPADGRTPGDIVPVRLHARVTEVGTLKLEAVAQGGDRWEVEFDVRGDET